MWIKVTQGILIPFLGTSLGAACVFFMRGKMSERLSKALTGFASGIMVSASFFSLIAPALEQSSDKGKLAFVPATIGFLVGMLFLLVLDVIIPHIHMDNSEEGLKSGLKRTTKLVLAVTLHNLPEGMAVGIVYAGWVYGDESISMTSALALAIGIALQNFPEGAAIALPGRRAGHSRTRAFLCGAASGVVEPVFGVATVLVAGAAQVLLPWMLAFAAGAMLYVVVEELIPEAHLGNSHIGTLGVMIGFLLMMTLDVAL